MAVPCCWRFHCQARPGRLLRPWRVGGIAAARAGGRRIAVAPTAPVEGRNQSPIVATRGSTSVFCIECPKTDI
jgi:hypothetical protein